MDNKIYSEIAVPIRASWMTQPDAPAEEDIVMDNEDEHIAVDDEDEHIAVVEEKKTIG